jgi:hypothetical protein
MHRPVDASVVGPIARMRARQHRVRERVVNPDLDQVPRTGLQLAADLATPESRVALALVLGHDHAVELHLGGVEDRLELQVNRRVGGRSRHLELAPVEGHAIVVLEAIHHLPGVRHGDRAPSRIPVLAKLPLAVQRDVEPVHRNFRRLGGRSRGHFLGNGVLGNGALGNGLRRCAKHAHAGQNLRAQESSARLIHAKNISGFAGLCRAVEQCDERFGAGPSPRLPGWP